MSQTVATDQRCTLASYGLIDAWTDLCLSRQAIRCSPATLQFYQYTTSGLLRWAKAQGVGEPNETPRLIRYCFADLTERGKADKTLHAQAQAICTVLRFWATEGCIAEDPKIVVLRVDKKRLPVLNAGELRTVLKAANIRDRAVVMLAADTGLWRAQICTLDWKDLDFASGLAMVRRGKGRKAPAVVCGVPCFPTGA